MSRAFVKEDQMENPGDAQAYRVQSGLPNYMTPQGFTHLQQEVERLAKERAQAAAGEEEIQKNQDLARIDRDLGYYQARLESAIVVDTVTLPADRVHFGTKVTVLDAEDQEHTYIIVGEDEVDVARGRVSWASPLARALMSAQVGDVVNWERPNGTVELEVVRLTNATPEDLAEPAPAAD